MKEVDQKRTQESNNTNKVAFKVNSDKVQYTEDAIIADYMYDTSVVEMSPEGQMTVRPKQELIKIKTDIKVPKTGVMMVGWGGNNGTTVTAAILANRHKISYRTKHGIVVSFCASFFTCSTKLKFLNYSICKLNMRYIGNEGWVLVYLFKSVVPSKTLFESVVP